MSNGITKTDWTTKVIDYNGNKGIYAGSELLGYATGENAEETSNLITATIPMLKALQFEVNILSDKKVKDGWSQEEANAHRRMTEAIDKALNTRK